MSDFSEKHIGDTVRIRRPARVTTDECGRTVWMGGVDPCAFEILADVATDPYDSTVTEADEPGLALSR